MSQKKTLPAEDVTVADPAIVLDLIEAFRRSKAMFAAVSLGVFDALQAGPCDLPALAEQLSCSQDGLERLLDACVGLGLLSKAERQYANTPAAAAYLTSSSPRRLTGYIGYSNTVMWKLWAHLEDAVREGTHRWPQAYGWEGPIFSHFFKTEAAKREFLMGMHGYGLISSPHVVGAFDLSRFRHLVDLGGATGHLACAACQRYPQLRATVFDLPDAIPLAREIIAQMPVADRVGTHGGDFFIDPLPEADLFAVGRILHDWSEQKVKFLLRRIFEALPPGGGLLIAEKLLADDKTSPRWAQLQSLNMLTCTEGKERSIAEYAELLQECGFDHVAACRTSSPLDAVLAYKPE
ncbi:MAG: class I SAM-dependent methyltransferase [Aureliella sp.]